MKDRNHIDSLHDSVVRDASEFQARVEATLDAPLALAVQRMGRTGDPTLDGGRVAIVVIHVLRFMREAYGDKAYGFCRDNTFADIAQGGYLDAMAEATQAVEVLRKSLEHDVANREVVFGKAIRDGMPSTEDVMELVRPTLEKAVGEAVGQAWWGGAATGLALGLLVPVLGALGFAIASGVLFR